MTGFIEVQDTFGRNKWLRLDSITSATEIEQPPNAKGRPRIILKTDDGEKYDTWPSDWKHTLASLQIMPAQPGFTILLWYGDRENVPGEPDEYPVIAWNLARTPPRPVTPAEDVPCRAYDFPQREAYFIAAIRPPSGVIIFQLEGDEAKTIEEANAIATGYHASWLRWLRRIDEPDEKTA